MGLSPGLAKEREKGEERGGGGTGGDKLLRPSTSDGGDCLAQR